MTTLADKSLLSGGDNKPSMLEKHLYDSWKSKMELYMMNIPHGRLILASVEKFHLFVANNYSGDLTILVFKHGDDLIDAINHMMSFLSVVVTSSYPTTNNQLRNSSNPRQQAPINDGRVTVQPVQGRQISYAAGTTRTFTPGASGSNSVKQRIVTCYNCKGEGHMSKQCTKPRWKWDDSWFKDKVLLVQAQASGQILHEEELAFLADPRIPEGQATHTVITYNVAYQADDLDAYDSDCDKLNTAKVALMANYLNFGDVYVIENHTGSVQNSNSSTQQDALILSVIEQLKTQVVNCTKINLENKSVNDTLTAELERYKEQVKVLNEGQNVDFKSKDNISDSCAQSVEIDHLKQNLLEHLKEKESLMQMVTLLKNDFKKEESKNIDREITLEKRIKQLDNIKAQQLEPKLYVSDTIKKTNAIVILGSKETLVLAKESRLKILLKQEDLIMLEKKVITTPVDYANSVNSAEPTLSSRPTNVEVLKELPKVSMVNTSLKKLKHYLTGFDVVVKERTHPRLSLRVRGGKSLVITALRDDLRKLKGKALVDNDVTKHPSDPEMLKIDVEPITPKLLNKQTAHSAYIKHTQEEAIVLRDLVEHLDTVSSDQTIANLKTQLVENELVRVKIPKCMAWLDDEPIRDLNTMEDKVDNPSPQSTLQVLPSFEVYTPPVTHPEEVEETIGISMEVEPLNETKLEEVGLNYNHNTPLSSRGDPSFDK
ncbi:integrase, catalytic region, zinc finger, CCHC-type containing protein [Tanacetum coccineum]